MDSIDQVLLAFDYDPISGIITRKKSLRKDRVGKPAGSPESRGYVQVRFHGRLVMAHQIAWAIFYGVWPDFEIDHHNLIKSDNRISNLRPATRRQNLANTSVRRDNSLGVKGVSLVRRTGEYRARIKENGRSVYLGSFKTIEEASSAYRKRHLELHGEFSRG